MMRKINHLVWAAVMVVPILIAPTAYAHNVNIYAPLHWTQSVVGWKFAPTFPTGSFRDRITDSATRWNNVTGVSFTFNFNGEGGPGQSLANPCDNDYNAVVWSNLIQYGGTNHCISRFGELLKFVVAIESRNDWNTFAGDNDPAYLESVAAHELGHAWGFGTGAYPGGPDGPLHFESSLTICVNDSTYHTMCNGLIPPPSKMMTLEAHDIDTFQSRY